MFLQRQSQIKEMEDIKEAVIMYKISSKRADIINKMIAFALIGLIVFVTIYYPQVYAFAADEAAAGADLVKNSVGRVYDILAAFVSSVGSIITLWMIFEMGVAVQSQEGTMQANGIKKVGGGLIMVLAPQLLSALTAYRSSLWMY